MSDDREKAIIEAGVRQEQWKYWAPVAVAPVPYVCVSLYRNAKTPRAKQLLLGVGMVGIPIVTYAARVYLMSNTGYNNEQDMEASKRRGNALDLSSLR
eukprot:scaffold2363_cov159-Amphora_coffeaeformis.AAC.5